jgi:hypothetical protein
MSPNDHPTDPLPPAPKPPRSAQDKKLAADLAAAEQLIGNALADTEAAPLLAEGGYTAQELNAGLALHQAALTAFVTRQTADGAQDSATKAFAAADKAAHKTYTTLRELGRSAFLKDSAALTALGLSGREPRDLQNFLTAADAFVRSATNPLYSAKLTARGVTAAKLQDLQAKLDALRLADRQQEAAKTATPAATSKRDRAAKSLFDWQSEFKAFAKAQLKDRPDISKRLGV